MARAPRWGPRQTAVALGATAIAVGLALAVTSYLVDGRPRLWDGPRIAVWKASLETARAHPWLGRGYDAAVAYVTDPRAAGFHADWQRLPPSGQWRDGHDVWLNVLGQAGLVGLAAFVWLVVAIGARVRRIDDPLVRAVFAGSLGGAFLYGGLFDAIEEARHLWAVAGLALAAGALWPRSRPVTPGRS